MRTFLKAAAVGGLIVLCGTTAFAQRRGRDRDERDDRPSRREGPPRDRPGPWEPGKVMPPHVRHELKLSDDQEKQLGDLEKEVKERILKILTDDQKKQLKELRFDGPPPEEGDRPQRRAGRPGPPEDRERPPRRGDRPGPPDDRRDEREESER